MLAAAAAAALDPEAFIVHVQHALLASSEEGVTLRFATCYQHATMYIKRIYVQRI